MTHVPATESLLGLALEHQQAGRLGEAEQLYHHLVNIAPYSAEAWYRYGLLAWQCRRLDDALACFERATALEPAQAEYSLHRAQLLHTCGRNADALALFRALVEANPALAKAHFWLGANMARRGTNGGSRGPPAACRSSKLRRRVMELLGLLLGVLRLLARSPGLLRTGGAARTPVCRSSVEPGQCAEVAGPAHRGCPPL